MEVGKLYRYLRYKSQIAMIVKVQPFIGNVYSYTQPRPPFGGETRICDKGPFFTITWLYKERTNPQLFTEESFRRAYERIELKS